MSELEGLQCVAYFNEQYTAKRSTHLSLPSREELDDAFEVTDYVQRDKLSSPLPIRLAVGCSLRWINGWMNTLHDLLMPNQQNAIALQEASALTDEDREHVHEVVDWIMYRNRTWNLLLVRRDDVAEAQFLKEFHTEWLEKRDKLSVILGKTRAVWEERMKNPEKIKSSRPSYTG